LNDSTPLNVRNICETSQEVQEEAFWHRFGAKLDSLKKHHTFEEKWCASDSQKNRLVAAATSMFSVQGSEARFHHPCTQRGPVQVRQGRTR
jgi:hypothetical protein